MQWTISLSLASSRLSGAGRDTAEPFLRRVGPGVVGGHLLGPGVLAVSRHRPVVPDVALGRGSFLLVPGLAEDDREPVRGRRVVHVPLAELG